MKRIRRAFTKWYVRRGYTYWYSDWPYTNEPEWICPWWVKPLLIFFSPAVYFTEFVTRLWIEKVAMAMAANNEPNLENKKD